MSSTKYLQGGIAKPQRSIVIGIHTADQNEQSLEASAGYKEYLREPGNCARLGL
jgi:hypothetical protein